MDAFALYNFTSWARQKKAHEAEQRALREVIEQRLAVVIDYRNSLIAKRDSDAAKIPLRPREERMWEKRIAEVDETIGEMRAELSANQ